MSVEKMPGLSLGADSALKSQKNKHPSGMPARKGCSTDGREPLLASLQDAGPFFQPFPVVSLALNHRLVRFDASGIGTVTLPESGYSSAASGSVASCDP
jgi:hypothetical protein